MKKKVLFALIALFSCLTTWAADVTIGSYKVTISAQYVVLGGTSGSIADYAPTISAVVDKDDANVAYSPIADGGVYQKAGEVYEKVTALAAGNTYYRMVKITDNNVKKALYVPFYVISSTTDKVEKEIIWNEDTYDASVANGVYGAYLTDSPWSYVWDAQEEKCWYPTSNTPEGRLQEWLDIKDVLYSPVSPDSPDQQDEVKRYVHVWDAIINEHNLINDFPTFGIVNPYQEGGAVAVFQNGACLGKITFEAEGPQYFLGKVKNFWPARDGGYSVLFNAPAPETLAQAYGNDFNVDYMTFYQVPAMTGSAAEVTELTEGDYELDYVNAFEFNGQVQKPLFSGESPVADSFIYLVDDRENALKEGVDFEVVYSNPESKTVGDYTFTINFIGKYEGTIASQPYRINGKSIAINLAYIYKTYGEPDPEVVSEDYFEVDPGALLGDDTKADIAQWLVVKRATGKEGEDVGQYEYYYDFIPEYYTECQYKIIPLQTTSNLIIRKAPLEIKVTNNWKKYKQNDPTAFTFTVTDETQLKNGDTAADVDAVVKRAGEESAVNAHLEKVSGQDVAVHNVDAPVYAFDLEKEATNYAITFANNFEIVPSDDYSGIQVIVSNNDGTAESNPNFQKNEYIYRGTAYEPGKAETAEVNDLVVMDGENRLEAGVDYTVKSYANNVHVGEADAATVTITLTGSYVEKDVTGTFTIEKAPLTITAKSYTLGVGDPDPATFEVLYEGFVNEETATTAKGFKAPSGVTKKAIAGSTGSTLSVIEDAEADDYEIKYEDGALSFGETILIVKADNKSKTYGETDPDLTVTVTKVDGQDEVEATEGEKAALNIGGTLAYTVTREEGENVDGGSNANKTYPISVDGPKKLLDGVIVVYRPGEFDINVKTVTLKGDNATKVYGDANPTFEASVWEVPAGETDPTKATKWSDEKKAEEGVINPNFYYVGVQGAQWRNNQWVLANNNVTAAGEEYAIEPHFNTNNHYTSSGNYLVVIGEAGKFSITPAPLTIKADDKSKSFSEADPALTITATGLKRNDQLTVGTDYTIAREKFNEEGGENVGTYTITVTPVENSAVLKNYTVTFETGTLTIGAMELAVIANDQAIYYGQTINPYDVTIIINGQPVEWTVDQIKEVLSLSTTVRKVGFNKDAFTLNKVENANYNIADDAFTNGWLTIGQLKEIPLGKADLAKITDVELQQVLEDHKGLTVDVKLPPRKMKADEWYSWVLPFEVKPSTLFSGDFFGYGAAETLDANKSAGSNVVFTLQVAKEIPANTPFIVKVENEKASDAVNALVFKNVTIDKKLDYVNADPATVADGVSFVGLYYDYKSPKANERYLAAVTPTDAPADYVAHNEFWAGGSNTTVTIPRTMAILRFGSAEQAANARIFIEEEDGTLTEINAVDADAEVAYGEGWYTITGIKLDAEPTTSGTYIFNGKKVFIQK